MAGAAPVAIDSQGYEAIKPGYADRIIGWTESESGHRREMERRQQAWDNWKDVGGMIAAFTLATSVIAGGIYLLLRDKQVGGISALVAAIVPLIGALYWVRRPSSREPK